MGLRITASKCLVICLVSNFIMVCCLTTSQFTEKSVLEVSMLPSQKNTKKRLAVLVPFRDRFEELLQFVPHMHSFLNKQKMVFHIFIIQQVDNNRFNRASLLNVGYLLTKDDYDYIAMHDVDLLPLNDNLKYEYPNTSPIHISSPQTHPKYHYETFIGGILLVKNEHFELVQGMSNNYWGWGLEDDEFYLRLKEAGLEVKIPENVTSGIRNTFKHIHDKTYRRRDISKCYNQQKITPVLDRVSGLHDVAYKILSQHNLTVDELPFTVVNVALFCNETATPWCQCPINADKNNYWDVRTVLHQSIYSFVGKSWDIVARWAHAAFA